jgi:hypothetical protein
MHEVLEPLDLVGRKGNPKRPSDQEKVQESCPGNLLGFQLSGKERCVDARTPNARNSEFKERIYVVDIKRESDHWISR